MSDVYEVKYFELDYCQDDVARIAAAIQSKASLLVVGMPGCGKSRLIDFLLHRPGVLEKHGLPDNLHFIRVDGDMVTTGAQGMVIELLRALEVDLRSMGDGNLDVLKNQLITAVGKLEPDADLVVVFDNFVQSLQQALGETFFNFLFALRNSRPRLNIVYIFMANLKLDFSGFYKMDRLFDKGVDRSICWLLLLNRKDTFFSIERQLYKAGTTPDGLDQAHKARIYQLAGGHALMTRYLTHLILSGEVSVETEPIQALEHGGIRAACKAIWNDLEPGHRNFLVDVATGQSPMENTGQLVDVLQNYGVLNDQMHFFSLLFESFVKTQQKSRAVLDVHCDDAQTNLVVRTIEAELSVAIHGLSRRKRRLLCYLLENQGETCPKDRLIEIGWPTDHEQGVSDRALGRQIDGIRSWLTQPVQLSQHIAIETAWGEGYQLVLKD